MSAQSEPGGWAAVVASVDADVVLLACTELPLLPPIDTPKQLLDVTQLVADEMARLAAGGAADKEGESA